MKKKHTNQGFGLLEIVVGVSVVSVTLFGIMTTVITALKLIEYSTENIQASYLLEEGVETVKVLRDISWGSNIDTLTVGVPYFLVFENNNWHATSTPIYIDNIFLRSFVLQDVNRDANDDIVEFGGAQDPDTKKLIVSVEWQTRNETTTKKIEAYLTNMFNN
jgi:hypothetical protein